MSGVKNLSNLEISNFLKAVLQQLENVSVFETPKGYVPPSDLQAGNDNAESIELDPDDLTS
ncbi:MAG: hypothetical protein MRY79_02260 [Alphaproteobacteria bacterium]|nr:hypothetical protein [Alphaproteobacteria bacterium]